MIKEIPIEEVSVNDMLLSFNEKKKVYFLDKVILVYNHKGHYGTCINVEI